MFKCCSIVYMSCETSSLFLHVGQFKNMQVARDHIKVGVGET